MTLSDVWYWASFCCLSNQWQNSCWVQRWQIGLITFWVNSQQQAQCAPLSSAIVQAVIRHNHHTVLHLSVSSSPHPNLIPLSARTMDAMTLEVSLIWGNYKWKYAFVHNSYYRVDKAEVSTWHLLMVPPIPHFSEADNLIELMSISLNELNYKGCSSCTWKRIYMLFRNLLYYGHDGRCISKDMQDLGRWTRGQLPSTITHICISGCSQGSDGRYLFQLFMGWQVNFVPC